MFDSLFANEIGFHHYVVAGICLICAVTDGRSGKIYNAVTYPAIVFGIAYNALSADRGVITASVGGFLAGLLPFGFAAARGLIGGGDVKLFAAVGAIAGFFFLLDSLFNCFIVAAIYIILLFVWQKIRKRDPAGTAAGFGFRGPESKEGKRAAFRKRQIRLGVFIFIGVCLSLTGMLLAGGSGQ